MGLVIFSLGVLVTTGVLMMGLESLKMSSLTESRSTNRNTAIIVY